MKNNTLEMRFGISLLLIFIFCKAYGQSNSLFIPVTTNAPFFVNNINEEFQFTTLINNYGLYHSFSGICRKKIITLSIQHNNGHLKFDPLHFNRHPSFNQDTHLIQTTPTHMFYTELGAGYQLTYRTQKLSWLAGLGQQFTNKNTRCFFQLNWGNESKLINAGFSIRTNFSIVQEKLLLTTEPSFQAKIKIKNFRIVHQFGYCIPMKVSHDYAKPVFTIGVEYLIKNV